jgi:S-DNA-T family DNA segregation ATPase FtsK/SpoIIIE
VSAELEVAGPVVDAELVDLPVRPAAEVAIRAAPVPAPWQVEAPERRPVVAPWLREAEQRKQAVTWAVGQVRHVSQFHAVRSPRYLALAGWYAPRGLWRLLAIVTAWVFDWEARPLRLAERDKANTADYLKLRKERDAAVHRRALIVGVVGAVLAAGAVVGWVVTAWWVHIPVLFVALFALGRFGATPGKPLIPAAVVPLTTRKLSPGIVTRAFTVAKLCGEDSPITFATPIHRDANGYRVVIDLPFGVTADDAMSRRAKIASGLDVDERQVFLSRVRGASGSARRVALWVCDVDPLSVPAGMSPLIDTGRVNFWEPWPFGVNERGVVVPLCLLWQSMLVGAVPRQGKTFSARLPALAAALDPHVQIRIHDMKGSPDWVPFRHVAHRLFYGDRPDPDTGVDPVLALLDGAKELLAEVDRRNRTLRTLPAEVCPQGKLTEELSRTRSAGMPLILFVIDEVQRAFRHKTYGAELDEVLTDLVKVGPSTGIITVAATQKPDSKSTPTGFRDQFVVKFALRVTTMHASEAILGAGAYGEGLDASLLSPDVKGCGLLRGTGDDGLEVLAGAVRTYLAEGLDAEAICLRGKLLRERAGTLDGMASGLVPMATPPAYSVAADLATVMATDKKAHSDVLCSRLADRWPERYAGWEPAQLSAALKPFGVKTRQVWAEGLDGETGNRYGVLRAELFEALDEPDDRVGA